MPQPNRRTFLKATAAALAAPVVQAAGASEAINLGVIGCGGRATWLLSEALKLGHRCVALCDVAEFRLDKLSKIVDAAGGGKPEFHRDYRKLLEQRGLDAVIIATPDHHHREHLVAAVTAGKDAYIEKPLSKTIEEGQEMARAVRQNNRIVQVGNQRHSGPHWARCREVIRSDAFGTLVWVKVWDCRNWLKHDPFAVPDWWDETFARQVDWDGFLGNAPKRPFDPARYWAWRWYWDYAGGLMTDIGAHQLDIVQWLGGADAPRSVVANGGNYHFKHWETPDVIHGVWDYGKFAATFAVEFVNGADGVGAAFYGTKQTVIADADKEIRLYDTSERITPEVMPIESWPSRNETDLHVRNWLECVKSRKEPNSPIELGHRVIVAAHLANLSYRAGKKVFWDDGRQEATFG